MVLLSIMLFKMDLTFSKIIICYHSNETHLAVLSCSAVYSVLCNVVILILSV